jgi:diacylglycerol kinase family enzyme
MKLHRCWINRNRAGSLVETSYESTFRPFLQQWLTIVAPNTEWTHVKSDHIVAVFPSKSLQNGYQVLYVVENETKDDKKASPVSFHVLAATSPPQQLVHDFQPAGQACIYTRMTRNVPEPNFHVIVSTGSGTGQAPEVWNQLLKPFLEFVRDNSEEERYKLHFTTSETTVSDLTRSVFLPRANAGVAQSIVLLSGDGGLVDMTNVLLSEPHSTTYQKPNIAILPLGTGNALAHSSGVTKDKTLGLSTLIRGSPKEIPLFRATFSPGARLLANEAREELELPVYDGTPTCHGAVVCSWGLHAGLVADSDTAHYRQFGAERFQMAAKEALYPSDGSLPHHYRGKISILRSGESEWQSVDRTEHSYVLATLVSHLESGFHISPSSQPLDGKLRLLHFGPMSGDEVMKIMTAAYQDGKHVEDDRVGYEEVAGLRIEFDEQDPRWRRICIDGKIVRVGQGGWVEVRSGAGQGVVDLIAM